MWLAASVGGGGQLGGTNTADELWLIFLFWSQEHSYLNVLCFYDTKLFNALAYTPTIPDDIECW